MKSILVLALLSLILVIGVSQAEAYDGKIKITIEGNDFIEGDKIPVSILLIGDIEYRSENTEGEIVETNILEGAPDKDTPLEIMLVEKGTGLAVEQITSTPDWIYDDITFPGEPVWKASFEFDTSSDNLTAKTTYYIKAVFDDKEDVTGIFAFNPPVPQQAIEAGEFMVESESQLEPREIPSWVRDIFVFYAENQIDDETLLNAIEYLLSVEIITIR